MWRKIVVSLSFLQVTWTAGAAGKLAPEQVETGETGIKHYNQFKTISVTPFLETAAKAGDAEAQYYLDEALRKNNLRSTEC